MNITVTDPVYIWPFQANQFGLWCFTANTGVWYSTSDLTFDSKFEAARGLGTATLALGLCVWIFYLFAGCCRFGPMIFRFVGFLCFCCGLFQALVFLVQQSIVCSGNTCGLSTGANCGIAATVLWFVAMCMSCAAGKVPEEEGGAEEADEEADEEEK